VLVAFYSISALLALAAALDDLDIASVPFRDQLPVILLGAAGATGLFLTRVKLFALRLWYRVLLGATMLVAAINLTSQPAFTVLATDYLLLAFFCVTLYYQERLIFFDLLIKRAAFAALALTLVTTVRLPDPVTVGLSLTPLLLVGPWADGRLGRWIDRTWLRRRYPAPEAERLFTNELQLAITEQELRARAEHALTAIFSAAAQVCFRGESAPHCARDVMVAALQSPGWVMLKPRHPGIPYMSDDQRLFDSLCRSLGVMLENVRFREQQRRQQMREQELLLLAGSAKLKALRAQVNPHFLFNALNAIAGLIPIQPTLADQTLEELAKVFRYTLRKSEDEWVRLEEEVEFVCVYSRVEQARFADRLRVQIDVDPATEGVPVPAVSIQPLIENAIRHGASQVEGGGVVALRASLERESLLIEVSDNGPGFPEGFSLTASTGHGLRNVADRLSGYYGESAEL
jgi:signal transduction histidine kinase